MDGSARKSAPALGLARSARTSALRRWLERAGIALLGAAGVVLSFGDTPLWWFGGTLVLVSLSLLLRVTADTRRGWLARFEGRRRFGFLQIDRLKVAQEALCIAALTLIALVMMRDLLGGERPVSHDHTVHYVKAWYVHKYLLPRGLLYGWSQSWFAGYPIGYLYPPGADLWVNAVHALGFGALRFSSAYAVAIVLFHVFTGLSMYRLGRVMFGRWVGLLAGILALTDMASFRMGGWDYTMEWGVWPQTLSLNFSLMALCSMPALATERRLAPIGAFALWMGLAIISHPMQLVFLLLLATTALLASIFAPGVHSASAAFRIGLSSALALLVASLWLIPFLSSRSETSSMGVWWDTTYEIGRGLLDLTVFPGTLALVLGFGILGAIAMLRSRAFGPLFVALTALLIPAVTNSTFIDELHLTSLLPSLAKIQFVRLSIMVKPFWFVLAAYAAVAFARFGGRWLSPAQAGLQLGDDAPRPRPLLQHAMFVGVLGLLLLPFLVPAAQAFFARQMQKSLTTESERPYGYDRQRLETWLLTEMPKDGFFRVGVFMGHNHELMDLGAVIDRPIFKRGFTPVSNFVYQMAEADATTYEAVNLRFAISKVKLPGDQFEPVANFGIYDVYRFKRWDPKPFQILEGSGDVEVERFSDEEIVLRAAKGSLGKLRLNVSYFSRWHVYLDGQPLPMTLTYMRKQPDTTGFMTVPLRPGQYRFVFERTLGDRVAIPLGILGALLCIALMFAERVPRAFALLRRLLDALHAALDRLSGSAFRRPRAWLAAVSALVVLGCAVALAQWRPPLTVQGYSPIDVRRVRYDFLERLSKASVSIGVGLARQPCIRQGDRHVCRGANGEPEIDNYVGSTPATLKDYILTRCIRARPLQDSVLEVSFPNVPLGERIFGYFGIEREGRLMFKRRPVDFRIVVDSEMKYEGHTQNDNKIHWFDVPLADQQKRTANVSFLVEAANVTKRYFCFHAQMVDTR